MYMQMIHVYLSLDTAWPLSPEKSNCLEEINNSLVSHSLEHNTQSYKYTCSAHPGTEKILINVKFEGKTYVRTKQRSSET